MRWEVDIDGCGWWTNYRSGSLGQICCRRNSDCLLGYVPSPWLSFRWLWQGLFPPWTSGACGELCTISCGRLLSLPSSPCWCPALLCLLIYFLYKPITSSRIEWNRPRAIQKFELIYTRNRILQGIDSRICHVLVYHSRKILCFVLCFLQLWCGWDLKWINLSCWKNFIIKQRSNNYHWGSHHG